MNSNGLVHEDVGLVGYARLLLFIFAGRNFEVFNLGLVVSGGSHSFLKAGAYLCQWGTRCSNEEPVPSLMGVRSYNRVGTAIVVDLILNDSSGYAKARDEVRIWASHIDLVSKQDKQKKTLSQGDDRLVDDQPAPNGINEFWHVTSLPKTKQVAMQDKTGGVALRDCMKHSGLQCS